MHKQLKIAIIGCAGSGKSTLAKKLGDRLFLPIYHLDQYFWKPNWIQPDLEAYKQIHHKLCDKDAWIIEGMNLRVLEYRIQKADVIIFLNIPRYLCFWRIFKRTLQYYGQETPASAIGCRESIDKRFFDFLKWVWGFKTNYLPKITELLSQYKNTKTIYILTSQNDIDQIYTLLKHPENN